MRVAGLGFNSAATLASLKSALQRAGETDALATEADKAEEAVVQELSQSLGLPLMRVAQSVLARQEVLTSSPRVKALYGVGSVAEAAALAAAGEGARLMGARVVSADGHATAAIAVRDDE